MGKRDPGVTAYIAKQQEFAKPILAYLRDVIHEGCPEVAETLQWNTPSYVHHGLLCGTAGFKQHVVFGFWKWKVVRKAATTFDAFSPSKQRDYLEWITEAKSDETREKRLGQAVEWMAEGKARNWKYER